MNFSMFQKMKFCIQKYWLKFNCNVVIEQNGKILTKNALKLVNEYKNQTHYKIAVVNIQTLPDQRIKCTLIMGTYCEVNSGLARSIDYSNMSVVFNKMIREIDLCQ